VNIRLSIASHLERDFLMSTFPNMPPSVPPQNMGMKPHRGGLILGLGIGGLAGYLVSCASGVLFPPCSLIGFLTLIASIFAWVMANKDIAEMQAGTMDPTGMSNTKAGKICGIINVALICLGIIITVVALIAGAAIFGGLLAGAAAGGAAGGGTTP
jgi:hypothetical protein